MSGIEFIGEGPSPREVASFYMPGLVLPEFRQRYQGEFADMYAANGWEWRTVARTGVHKPTLLEVMHFLEASDIEAIEKGALLGPVVEESGLTLTGLSIFGRVSSPRRSENLSLVA